MNDLIFYIIILWAIIYSLYRLKKVIIDKETSCSTCSSNKSCSSAYSDSSDGCSGELAITESDKEKIKALMKSFKESKVNI